MAKCAKSKKDPHACENLHNLIRNNGNQLPVKVSTVPCWIRTSRKRVHQVLTNYPVLRMVDWVKTIFSYGGHFFLGGKSLDDAGSFREDLTTFWRNYQVIDPSLPFFAGPGRCESSWANTIPIAVHGDEGRGKCKNPIMVTSVQPIMPLCGNRTNMQGFLEHNPANIYIYIFFLMYDLLLWGLGVNFTTYNFFSRFLPQPRPSMCTRLLFTVLPSPYSKKTFHKLLQVLTDDLIDLETNGLTVSPPLFVYLFHFCSVPVGRYMDI